MKPLPRPPFGRLSACILIAVSWPLHLVISALIWLQDRGPALYRARRLGCSGEPFLMLKYRTMRVGGGPIISQGYKTVVYQNDPRVTFIGRVLRVGIDELPQLVNIARGEMNWVGPRPDDDWAFPLYGNTLRQRLRVPPGITGLSWLPLAAPWPTGGQDR